LCMFHTFPVLHLNFFVDCIIFFHNLSG